MTELETKKAKRKWWDQRQSARRRGIDWDFPFEDWLQFWINSGHWHERGIRTKGSYVMSRFGDKGPYRIDNVEIKTNAENVSEASAGRPWPANPVSCLHCRYTYQDRTFTQHIDSERCRQKKAPRRVLGY